MIAGIRVIENAFIQTVVGGVGGTVTVYPTYIFGDDAYGIVDRQKLNTYVSKSISDFERQTSMGGTIETDDSDPIAQRYKVGMKAMFAVKLLRPECMMIVETSSSLSYAFGV